MLACLTPIVVIATRFFAECCSVCLRLIHVILLVVVENTPTLNRATLSRRSTTFLTVQWRLDTISTDHRRLPIAMFLWILHNLCVVDTLLMINHGDVGLACRLGIINDIASDRLHRAVI